MERAFLYGDLLFETILFSNGHAPHIARHYSRLAHSANILKMDLCGLNEEKFNKEIYQAVQEFQSKNANSSTLRIRFVLFRQTEGFYLPISNSTNFHIIIFRFEPKTPIQPIKMGIYKEQHKAPGILANLKTGNALIYVMAAIWAKENGYDDALILNTNGEIIEATSSNIFWQKNGLWFSPPIASGCVAGIGRQLFMAQYPVTEKPCTPQDLAQADNCLLTNALTPQTPFTLAL
jgi:branched-chain amino acid aminotransferase